MTPAQEELLIGVATLTCKIATDTLASFWISSECIHVESMIIQVRKDRQLLTRGRTGGDA